MSDSFEILEANHSDQDDVFDLLEQMHEENGRYSLNEEKVYGAIAHVLDTGLLLIMRQRGKPVGTCALTVCEPWYSQERHLGDMWFYISPEFRSHRTFNALLNACIMSAKQNKVPLQIDLNSTIDTERKENLFSRHADQIMRAYEFRPVGGTFNVRM